MSGLEKAIHHKVAWSICRDDNAQDSYLQNGHGVWIYYAAFADLAVSLIVHLADMPASGHVVVAA